VSLSLVDVGRQWFEDAVDTVIGWFRDGLVNGYNALTAELFGTPVPETDGAFVFGEPTNAPWPELYDALVGGEIMLLALVVLLVSVQGRHTIRIFDIGNHRTSRKARRTAWVGAVLVVTWYWIAVLVLFLVDGFTVALLPDIGTLTGAILTFLTVSFRNPALAFLLAFIGGFAMWALQALLFIREILLYVYLYAMPLGLAVAFGGIPVVSRIATRLCLKFVPLAILPLPVAILFQGYELLFGAGTAAPIAPESAFLQYLVGAMLPILSLLVVWKLFAYASPLTAAVLGGATKGIITVGAILGAAKVAGPLAATTAARWGPKAAAWHTVGRKVGRAGAPDAHTQGDGESGSGGDGSSGGNGGTAQDNVVTDAAGQRGIPEYRRTENDPGYY